MINISKGEYVKGEYKGPSVLYKEERCGDRNTEFSVRYEETLLYQLYQRQ